MDIRLLGRPVNTRRLVVLVAVCCLIAVAAVLFLPAKLVRYAVAGAIGFPFMLFLLDKPKWIFYFLIFVLCSNIDILIPFKIFRITLLFFLVAFAIAVMSGRRIVVPHRLFVLLVCLFLLVAFQSLVAARDFDSYWYRLSSFVKVLINIAIIFQFTRDRREFRTFLLVLAFAILLNDFLPFIKEPSTQQHPLTIMWGAGVYRYEGYALEPNTFAMIQNLIIPVLIFFFAVHRRPRIARPIFLAAVAASIFVLILSFSRGGFVGLVALVATLLIVERRNKAVLATGLAIILAGAVFAPGVYWERIRSLADFDFQIGSDYALMTRIRTMELAVRLGLENPLFGIGLENFRFQAAFYVPYKLPVHNVYLQIFSELGVLGLLAFLGIVVYNLRVIGRLMRRTEDPEAAQLGRLLLVQQVAVLVNSNFIPTTYDFFLWFALALPAMAGFAYLKHLTGGIPSR